MNENEIIITQLEPELKPGNVGNSDFIRNAAIGGATVLLTEAVIWGAYKLIKRMGHKPLEQKVEVIEEVDCEQTEND